MIKVYAVADFVPEGFTRYIVQGREYPVKGETKLMFEIVTPLGLTQCAWKGSFHLDGGDWRRIEREE